MAKQVTEAIITLNGKQPIEVLNQIHSAAEKIKTAMEDVQEKMKGMSPKDEAYKNLSSTVKDLKKQYDVLASAQVKDIEATDRLRNAVDNLATTSLTNLRKALGDGKRKMDGLSEAELEQANTLRSLMKTVGDQIRLLEGKYVKIREGLASIGTQSDQWLSKAIAQQQELMAATRRGTKEYKDQEQVLQMLTAEQDKRNAAISAEATARRQAQFKQQVASSRQMLSSGNLGNYSQSEIQTSINTLRQAQSQVKMGGSEWTQFAEEIKKAEAELDKLMGKTKEVKQQMSEGEAKSILGNIGDHTEQEVREAINALKLLQSQAALGGNEWKKYADEINKAEVDLAKFTGKLKEVKQGMTDTDFGNRWQNLFTQSEQSMKEMIAYLSKAKDELTPFSQEWQDVANKLSIVKDRMAEVQANSPYVRNEANAQAIARQNQLQLQDGSTRDVTRKDLQWSKDYLQKQLDVTPVADTVKIREIQEALGLIDERMKALDGNTEKATMSAEKLEQVLGDMKTASLEELRDAAAELKKQLNGLAPSSDAAKQIKKQLQDLDKEINQVQDDVVDVNDVISRSKNGKASIEELKKAYKQLQQEIEKIDTDSNDFKSKRKALDDLKKKIDTATGAAQRHGNAWNTALKNLTAYVGLFQVFNTMKDLIMGVIKKNFEMSDSLADIRKVSGLVSRDIDKMAVSLSKIDTRTTVQELNQIAYAGAKLGIGDMGVEALEGFVRASNQVNVALKEDLGEEALTSLAKITEVMGLIPKMGVEQSMLKTGSAIFKLASTTTATSNKIVDFSNRLLAMGKTGALSTADILALGAAVDSMAMEPEVASTAFAKLITEIRQGTNLIEKDLGLAKGSLKELLNEGKGMEALQMIFHKMHDSGNVFALNSLFKDLGSEGSRLIKVMVTMADKVDMLDKVVKTSNEAFNEGMAVTQEYNIQQETAQGILERANNLFSKAFVNPDGINSVKQLAIAWYDFARALTTSSTAQKSMAFTLTSMVTTVKILINILPGLIGFFAGQGLVKGGAAVVRMAQAIWAWVSAQRALNLAMSANAIGALISALALAYTWFQKDANAADDAAKSTDNFSKSLGGVRAAVGKAKAELDGYKRAIDEAQKGTKQRQAAIDNFNSKFGSYLSKLLTEKSTAQDIARAYNEAADAIERKVYAQAKSDDVEKHVAPRAANAAKRLYDYDQKAKALGLGQYGGNWLKAVADDNLKKIGTSATIRKIISMSGVGSGLNSQAQAGLKNTLFNTNAVIPNKFTWKYVGTNPGGGKYIEYRQNDLTERDKMTAMAVSYVRQYAAQIKAENDVREKFKFYEEKPLTENVNGVTVSEQVDKDALKQEAKDKREQKEAWRKDLKEKQEQAQAIIADLGNYFDRQINAKMGQAISLGMDETEKEEFVAPLRQQKLHAQSEARKAIAGKTNKFDDVKKSLPGLMVEKPDEAGYNLSQDLLDGILKNDISKLRDLMAQLGKNLGMSMDSIVSEIFAKATRNEQENLKLQFKQMESRRKVAQEHDYIGIVKQNMYDDFNTMGYAPPTADETAIKKKVVDGKEVLDVSAFENRRKAIEKMFETARKGIASLYSLDVSTKDGRGILMKMLFGDNQDGMAARITESLGESEESWKSFYLKLIQYSDSYTEAEKKQYDNEKKIVDFWWTSNKRNLANQDKLRKMQNESNLFGKRTNLLSNLGLANLTADPEVELMKARMQAAEDYYSFVEKNSKNQQLIDEAERARQEAELNYANQMATAMKNRLALMKELVQPITDFGAAVGNALAEMKNDAESANEAIKNALKSMLQSWGQMALNDINTQMWKAINDAGAKKGRKDAQPGIEAARANATANATDYAGINWRDIGTENNPLWVRWTGDHYEDKDGTPYYTKADGTPLSNTDNGTVQNEPPRAWQKRHPDGTMDDYNREVQGIAGQTGDAIANVATGNSSLGEADAGLLASGANVLLNAPVGGGKSKEDKEKDKQLKNEKKHQKELTKETKKGTKDRERENEKGVKKITKDAEEANKEQTKGEELKQQGINTLVDAGLNTTFQLKRKNDKEELQSEADTTRTQMTFSIAGAIGKCFQFLGPIAGPIAAAVVMSTLTGLLNWALSSAFSSKSNKSSSGKNTKLVSGMLTYDSGNVQDLKPFVADNGEVYWAAEQSNVPASGVSLLNTPTATTINGQRSLVAENGPELVIGRETTHAMMMNNPSLLKALVNYDSNYSGRNAARRTFDEGNVGEALGANGANLPSVASATDDVVSNATATNIALLQAVNALLERLSEPISAKIDMYGRGNLYDSMTKANQFMKGKS